MHDLKSSPEGCHTVHHVPPFCKIFIGRVGWLACLLSQLPLDPCVIYCQHLLFGYTAVLGRCYTLACTLLPHACTLIHRACTLLYLAYTLLFLACTLLCYPLHVHWLYLACALLYLACKLSHLHRGQQICSPSHGFRLQRSAARSTFTHTVASMTSWCWMWPTLTSPISARCQSAALQAALRQPGTTYRDVHTDLCCICACIRFCMNAVRYKQSVASMSVVAGSWSWLLISLP